MYFTGFDCLGCRACVSAGPGSPPVPELPQPARGPLRPLPASRREVDRDAIARRPAGVWRWTELLPVLDPARIVTLGEAARRFSARAARPRLRRTRALAQVRCGQSHRLAERPLDHRLGDQGRRVRLRSSLLRLHRQARRSSTAAYAARAGLQSVVFCPKDTPVPKMAQAVFFGARLIRVDGHYSQINAMYRRLIGSGRVKWYDCGTDNPFRYEGKKTYAYEIAQDLDWRAPDRVLHPAAGGMSSSRPGRLQRAARHWLVDRLPMMTAGGRGVRAHRGILEERSAAVAPVDKQSTIASALAAADPWLLGDQASAAIRASNGRRGGRRKRTSSRRCACSARKGSSIEPSGAVTVAAVRRGVREGTIGRDESVVCVLSPDPASRTSTASSIWSRSPAGRLGPRGYAGRSRADRLEAMAATTSESLTDRGTPGRHGARAAGSSRRPWATTCPRPGWGTRSTPRGRRRGSTEVRRYAGVVGRDVSAEDAYLSARDSALNCLACVKQVVGSLDRVDPGDQGGGPRECGRW